MLDAPAGDDIATVSQALLTQAGGGHVFRLYRYALSGFAARLSVAQVAALAESAQVRFVVPDRIVAAGAVQLDPPSHGLDRIDQHDLPLDSQYLYPDQAGAGVHIYVIDSGLNAGHEEFAGRVGGGRNFSPNNDGVVGGVLDQYNLDQLLYDAGIETRDYDFGTGLFAGPTDPGDTTDCFGHGTAIAGIAAGARFGVAKKATIHPVRIFGCARGSPTSTIVGGIDWVAGNRIVPAVANLSLWGAADDALDEAVRGLIGAGVTVVTIAGNNSGADACAYSPARVGGALTVGNVDRTDARHGTSNIGACVDLFAPGTDIPSAGIASSTATGTSTGTSEAAPHVTGAAALILGEHPDYTPAQVTDAVLGDVTLGVLTGVGDNSPNALLRVR